MIHHFLYQQDVIICIVVVIIIIIALWVFFGGKDHEYVGLTPLQPNQRISPYIQAHHPVSYSETNYGLWTDNEYTDILSSVVDPEEVDTTPHLPQPFQSHCQAKTCSAEVQSKRFESKGERKCREVLEFLYGKSFPCVRPKFLRNPETGRLMELDCYNEELKIAVEYNGIQHYVFPNFTNQSYDAFINQRRRDQLKVNLCDLHGVYLITVPYNVKLEDIQDYIVYYLPENVQKRRLKEIEEEEKRFLVGTYSEEDETIEIQNFMD